MQLPSTRERERERDIYIYRERDIEKERERERERDVATQEEGLHLKSHAILVQQRSPAIQHNVAQQTQPAWRTHRNIVPSILQLFEDVLI